MTAPVVRTAVAAVLLASAGAALCVAGHRLWRIDV